MRFDGAIVEDVRLVLGLYHMHTASHAVCFERLVEPGCGVVLSTGVNGCSWFSFSFKEAVSMKKHIRERGISHTFCLLM